VRAVRRYILQPAYLKAGWRDSSGAGQWTWHTIDGLVYASSMVILHAARHQLPVPQLDRWMLALGITASLAVNVAQGWSHGLVGAAAAAWPAVALVGSYEMLAWMIRTRPEADRTAHPHWTTPYHSRTSQGPARGPLLP
jgi:hypothetical protein